MTDHIDSSLLHQILETVRRTAEHGAADAEKAVAGGEARGDVTLVGEVAGVDLKPPSPGLVANHRIEQRVVRRAKAVGAIPGLADIAHAATDGDTRQADCGETVLRP